MPKLDARSAAPVPLAGLALWFGFLDRTHALPPELKAARNWRGCSSGGRRW